MSKYSKRENSKRQCRTRIKYNRLVKYKKKNEIPDDADDDDLCDIDEPIQCVTPCGLAPLYSVFSLLEKLNFQYEISPDSQTKQNSIYFQDKFMNTCYENYPEYLCLDILCGVPEIDRNLALFINLDSNGHCEIVSVGLIKPGNTYGISWLCEMFKKNNSAYKKIEIILFDHNTENKEILKRCFPGKLALMSFFHSIKAFKIDISNQCPIHTTSEDLSKAIQIFEKMIFVSTESEYIELMKQMKLLPSYIYSVFKTNWHSKKGIWVLGFYFNSKVFIKSFNTYLFDIRRRIKPFVSTQDSLESVIEKLHLGFIKLRDELFHNFTSIFQVPYDSNNSRTRILQKYAKHLTPHASELLSEQLKLSEVIRTVQRVRQYSYKVFGSEAVVTFNVCSCNFFNLMKLPCSHLFAVRSFLSLPLFFESFRPCWVVSNYKKVYLDLYSIHMCNTTGSEATEACTRFQKCFEISNDMWHLLVDCSQDVSQERLSVFQNLLKSWKNDFIVKICVSEKQNESTNNEALENLSTDYFREVYGISLNDILDSENEFSSLSVCSENPNEFL